MKLSACVLVAACGSAAPPPPQPADPTPAPAPPPPADAGEEARGSLDADNIADYFVYGNDAGVGGGGIGTGSPTGWGKIPPRGGGPRVPEIRYLTFGTMAIKGDYQEPIVRRYFRREHRRLQYCYERELVAQPQLAGTVTVRFKIDEQGKAASVAATGLAMIEACITHAVEQILFPKPPAGTVEVTFPLVFAQPKK